MFLGSGSDNDRQAMVFAPLQVIADGGTLSPKLRTAGLVRIKGVVTRVAGAATAFTLQFFGKVGDDVWTPIGPTTAMPAAATGQVVVISADTNGFSVVRLDIVNTPAGAGATTVSVTLSATWN